MAGKLSVQFELEMPEARSAGAKAGREFAEGFNSAFEGASATFKRMNPHLFGGVIRPPGEAGGPSGIGKLLAMGPLAAFNPAAIKGLRDVAGKDLAKVFSMGPLIPPGVIKGLRDVTGRDLAKVLALPDISSFDAKATNWRQAILGSLIGLHHPYFGAKLINDSGAFGGGGGKGGGMAALLGAGGSGGFNKGFAWIVALEVAAKGLHMAFEALKHSMEQGFKLFTESSRLGMKAGELFVREFAAKSIGVSVADLEKFMLRQQWGKARTSLQNFGAGASITNMDEMFKHMLASGERLVPIMDRISGEFYRVGFAGLELEREWHVFVALIGEQVTAGVKAMIEDFQILVQTFNDSGQASAFGLVLSGLLVVIEKVVLGLEVIFESFVLGIQVIGAAIETMIAVVINFLAEHSRGLGKVVGVGVDVLTGMPGLGRVAQRFVENNSPQKIDIGTIWAGVGKGSEGLNKMLGRLFGTLPIGAIDPAKQNAEAQHGGFKMSMNSAWEKMGFVIGAHRQTSKEAEILMTHTTLLKELVRQGKAIVHKPAGGARFSPA